MVSRALAAAGVSETLVHTGQHYDAGMSDRFFDELDLRTPDHHLGVHGGTHADMTGRMLAAIEPVLVAAGPDVVIVYGDTNSTLAGALAAAKLGQPVAHVEAGLRSFDRGMPEELNRVVADHVSSLLLCPTRTAVANLAREGIVTGVHNTGDVMYDAVLFARDRALRSEVVDEHGLSGGGYAVATVHRAGTTDDPVALAKVIRYLQERARELPVVLPLHPRTRRAVEDSGIALTGLLLSEPVGYLEMTRLVAGAACVYTDSGGLQKEAYFHRVPCVTLRDETEWVETIDAGWNRLWTAEDYRPRREIDDFGAGDAAERIVSVLLARVDG
jgi:UDP-GlcNAc3NAcA epimerase